MAAAVCALTALLLTVAPVAAQEVAEPDAQQPHRGHRLLLDVGFGYSLLHSAFGADSRGLRSASAAYLVPLGGSRFDLGIRASINGNGGILLGDRDTQQPPDSKLKYWSIGLRADHHLVDFYDGPSAASVGWYGFVEAGRGQFKFPVALPSSPPYVQSVFRGTAVNSGVGLWWLAGGNDYAVFGTHRRRFSLQVASELGHAYVWGQADAGVFYFEFVHLGLSF